MSEECVLNKYGVCCCSCNWRLEDRSHPLTDGKSMGDRRGWICAGFAFTEGEGVAISGWPEHGICEMHKGKECNE